MAVVLSSSNRGITARERRTNGARRYVIVLKATASGPKWTADGTSGVDQYLLFTHVGETAAAVA